MEYGRAVSLCLAPPALAAASEDEFERVCQHAGTALKLLLEPMPVNEGAAEEAGVHVPQRLVAKAERMRREAAAQLLQAVVHHPRVAGILELSKEALAEQLAGVKVEA